MISSKNIVLKYNKKNNKVFSFGKYTFYAMSDDTLTYFNNLIFLSLILSTLLLNTIIVNVANYYTYNYN